MMYASRLDEFGKPAWIAATVFGFWAFWPLGLAVLLFLALSGRLREWRMESRGFWRNMQADKGDRAAGGRASRRSGRSSGNHAFDAYRSETIQRLEDEQREFAEYLERLRQARDKSEFDQFMAERRKRPEDADNAVM